MEGSLKFLTLGSIGDVCMNRNPLIGIFTRKNRTFLVKSAPNNKLGILLTPGNGYLSIRDLSGTADEFLLPICISSCVPSRQIGCNVHCRFDVTICKVLLSHLNILL